MRHGISKRRFRSGSNANTMLLRKLVMNFIEHGSIVTTQQKVQYMKPSLDRLITHAKKDTRSSLNVLTSFFGRDDMPQMLKNAVGTVFKDRTSGYTTTVKLGQRPSDGAMMVKLTWITPVTPHVKVVTPLPTGRQVRQVTAKPATVKKTQAAPATVKKPVVKKKTKKNI